MNNKKQKQKYYQIYVSAEAYAEIYRQKARLINEGQYIDLRHTASDMILAFAEMNNVF